MIVNVFREGVDKGSNDLKLINENDSVEIKRIKELLEVTNLEYISNNLRYILGITKENSLNCFDKKNNEYRVIQADGVFRVILYIRLSVEDGDIIDGDVSKSIRNQLLYLLTECKNRNWKVVAIFCEEGISGADDNRPEWLKALSFCECGNTEIFLCKSQSRFSRSMEMIEKYLHKDFITWNVRFVGLVDSTDTAVSGNKKTRQINGLVNEWQVEDQSINTRNILKNKKSNGLFTGSFAPFGYIKDPKDKYHLIIDEPAAKIVKEIFDMYVEGKGYHLICKNLNERKIPTPTEYKKLQGSRFHCSQSNVNKRITYQVEKDETLEKIAVSLHSTVEDIMEYNNLKDTSLTEGQIIVVPVRATWNNDTIRKILSDETYIGTLVQGKVEGISYKDKHQIAIPKEKWIRVPHCHNAIIDKETWEIVSARFKNRGRTKTTKTGEVHLFSKKVYCACCGKVFQRNLCHVKDGKQAYMQCRERRKTGGFICNNNRAIRYDDLEKLVLDQINFQIAKYYDLTKIEKNYFAKQVDNSVDKDIKILENERANLKAQIIKKERALTMLYDDRVNGIIDATEFSIIKNQNTIDVDGYNKRITQINEEIIALEKTKNMKVNKEKIFKKYKKIEKLNRIVLDEFIDKIYIGNINPENKKRTFRIDWNVKAD